MTCTICSKSIPKSRGPAARCCSNECANEARRKWLAQDMNWLKARAEYHRQRKLALDRRCKACNGPMPLEARSSKKACSPACTQKLLMARRPGYKFPRGNKMGRPRKPLRPGLLEWIARRDSGQSTRSH